MTTQLPRSNRPFLYVAAAIVIAAVVISASILTSASFKTTVTKTVATTLTQTVTSTQTVTTTTSYPDGSAFLTVPKLYADLGYPKITYSSYTPYSPSKPNFTLEYQTKKTIFDVGSLKAPAMSLNQAVGLAAVHAKLDPVNYSLAEADFDPGVIVNSTLAIHPAWYLFFARAYDSYWLFGSYGSAQSVEVNLDAFNGTIYGASVDIRNLPTSGSYDLKVDSSRALQAVRSSNITGVPATLTKNGTVSFMEPRIALFGPSSNNVAFQNPLNASLTGMTRLCWVIELHSPTPQYGYQGYFSVDAETGQLVSYSVESLYPSMHIEQVGGSLDLSTTDNFNVSQEVFQMDGGVIGRPGSMVPVVVPNVIVVRPGVTARTVLNFSSMISSDVNVTLSLSNPLQGFQTLAQNGMPSGVSSFQFTRRAFVIPANGQTDTTLTLSIASNAPSKTYLLEVNATLSSPQWAQPGRSEILFFFSVWDGSGQWPPPPVIR